MGFRILWGIDAIVTIVVLWFFVVGVADGSVSSFNAGLWTAILAGIAVVMLGSLRLRAAGNLRTATALLSVLAIPALLFAVFFAAVLILQPRWN